MNANEIAPAFEDRHNPITALRRLSGENHRPAPTGDVARQAAEAEIAKALEAGCPPQQAIVVTQQPLDPHTSDWSMAVLRGALHLLRYEYDVGDRRLKPAVLKRVDAVLQATGYRYSDPDILRESFPSDVQEIIRLLGA